MALVEQECAVDIIELLLEHPRLFPLSEEVALATVHEQLKVCYSLLVRWVPQKSYSKGLVTVVLVALNQQSCECCVCDHTQLGGLMWSAVHEACTKTCRFSTLKILSLDPCHLLR